MLNDIFSNDWQSEDPKKRLQALAKLKSKNSDNQEVLSKLVVEDPDFDVRAAAILKMNHAYLVHQISLSHTDESTRAEADSRLHTLLGPKSELTEENFRALLEEYPSISPVILKFSPISVMRTELLDKLSLDEQCKLIGDIEYSETRQTIADKLESTEHLELARKLLRGKDKNAEKIIKAKLDVLHAQQKADQDNRVAAQEICEKVEHLAEHQWQTDDKTKYAVWCQRWKALEAPADEDLNRRFKTASAVIDEKIRQQSVVLESFEGEAQLAQNLYNVCLQTAPLSLQELANEKLSIITKLNHALKEWARLTQISTPTAEVSEQFLAAERALLSAIEFLNSEQFNVLIEDASQASPASLKLMAKVVDATSWPILYGELAALVEADARLTELAEQQATSKQQNTDKLDKLHKRIHRLLGTNKRGDLEVAKRELTAAQKAALKFSGKDKTALDERLEQASEAVQKMSDWKDFVTAPKYLELCEAMEALVDRKAHADKLSADIAELQKAWKALGHAECADQYWERFKTAGDKAYEPCAVFFKQRRELRSKNLQAREPIVQNMRELFETTDWDGSPDYKAVEAQLQSIHSAWQKIKDVERGPGQKQWKRLSKLKAKVYEKLDEVYDANIELKNQIILQTLGMLETDVKEESLGKLQLFQSRWKQVGVTRRKQDQAAWKNFKKASDQVYEKIQGVRNVKRAVEDDKINAYRNISRAIQQLAKTANNLAEADSTFDQLLTDYQAMPPLPVNLPEKLIKGVESDFRRSSDAFNKARDRIKKSGRAKIFDALANKATLCGQLEAAAVKGDAIAIEELQGAIGDIVITNKELHTRFEQRLAVALEKDRVQADQDRRLLCVDLEILLGANTPAEDAGLRMKIQLERMKKKGFGHGQAQTADVLKQLKIDWHCLPGAEPKLQDKLNQRFNKLVDSK
jgi:exonuclease SbcC